MRSAEVAGGQHQDRGLADVAAHGPQALGEGEAVLAGHHHVEHHQVEVEQPISRSAPAASAAVVTRKPARTRIFLQQLADAVVVVDDQQVAFAAFLGRHAASLRVGPTPWAPPGPPGCGACRPRRPARPCDRRATRRAQPLADPTLEGQALSVSTVGLRRPSRSPPARSPGPALVRSARVLLAACLVRLVSSARSCTPMPGRRRSSRAARQCERPRPQRLALQRRVDRRPQGRLGQQHQLQAAVQFLLAQDEAGIGRGRS
jgi:hypothetical protein